MILIPDDKMFLTRLNKTGETVNRCQVVSTDAKDFELASASSQFETMNVLGLIDDKHAINDTIDVGRIQTHGVMEATTDEWANAGIVGGLVAGTPYYLSTTPGQLTATQPTGNGEYIRQVGIAISETELLIDRYAGFERIGATFSGLTGGQPMISSGSTIVEAGEMQDGWLLVGATGLPPAPTTLIAGNGISIGLGAYIITISATPLSLSVNDASPGGLRGQPVYLSSGGLPPNVALAKADNATKARVIGLFKTSAADSIQSEGVLDLPTTSWDQVTGQVGGLTAGMTYYLDPATDGMLTTTAPTTSGQFVVVVGEAVSTTQMILRIREPIAL